MRRPKEIIIMGDTWKVKYKAMHNYSKWVTSTHVISVNKTLNKNELVLTLWHEIMEIITMKLGIHYKKADGTWFGFDVDEHGKYTILMDRFYDTIRRNKIWSK